VRPASRAVHAGRRPEAGDPLSPPIEQAAVYVHDSLETYDAIVRGDARGHVYGRNGNQTVETFAAAVAELEQAELGIATASGMSALLLAVMALVPRPRPLVVAADLYGVSLAMLREDLAPLGYELRDFDSARPETLLPLLDGAAAVICETVSNPLSRVADVPAIATAAGGKGIPLIVDNTFTTPVLCRPLEQGATLVVHSATKYLGGHSDLTAGVVCGSGQPIAAVAARGVRLGPTLGPFEAWLALRGLRTLDLRVRRSTANALALAEGLVTTGGVGRVHHPRLSGSEFHATAARLLPEGTGGMFAFEADGGREAAQRMLDRLRMVRFAASLGGVETTVSFPTFTSHRSLDPGRRAELGITDGTVRVSTGIEDVADLLEDFRQALER
jgi:methionine-gamma-lyase